jgi:MFS family permease
MRAGAGLSRDARLLIAGQGVRAAGYGFTAVLLGAVLAARGLTSLQVGAVLTAVIAGTAVASIAVGIFADQVGRRRCYTLFYAGLALVGLLVAIGIPWWALLIVALTGTLSTDVVDNGPATTLEQSMLAAEDAGTARVYGRYNMVGSAAGALGALAVTLAGLGRHHAAPQPWLFAALVPIGIAGALIASRLGPSTEAAEPGSGTSGRAARMKLGPSRGVVHRLAGLFAVDAAGAGLVTTGFLAYYFTDRYHTSVASLGWLFFAISVVQAASVAVAPVLARRYGLIATMVGSHLPSNILLASIAFAPSFPVAAALLLARTTLSQMDVPTRQALVMTVVSPAERTSASAVTNAARYTVRPIGPLIAGAAQQIALGAPLLIAGTVKGGYDIALWAWARHLPLGTHAATIGSAAATSSDEKNGSAAAGAGPESKEKVS